MKNVILIVVILLTTISCREKKEEVKKSTLVDPQATEETQNLHAQLTECMQKGILFGHQDALAYGHNWYGEPYRSDVKDVVDDYPAVIGWEIGHIEIDAPYNLDSIYFSDMKRYIQEGHKRGSVNTISWHGDNIVTGNTAWDCGQNTVVKSVLPGGENHDKYLLWLDRVSVFLHDLKDNNGRPIPVIFRMYHEHTGVWFWWGSDQCTPEEYKQLWIMTVERIRDKNNVHNVLYAYSPAEITSESHYLERYPGDEYVDILGFDSYVHGKNREAIENYKNVIKLNLDVMAGYATKANKIPCLSETGMESVWYDNYFTEVLYPLISDYKLSYVLLWRNAWEKDKREHYFVPFTGHPASADFNRFVEQPDILMLKDIQSGKLLTQNNK